MLAKCSLPESDACAALIGLDSIARILALPRRRTKTTARQPRSVSISSAEKSGLRAGAATQDVWVTIMPLTLSTDKGAPYNELQEFAECSEVGAGAKPSKRSSCSEVGAGVLHRWR